MRNPRDHTKRNRPAVPRAARRGTMYDRIAEAREKRARLLAEQERSGKDAGASGTIAALRGKSAPDPLDKPSAPARPIRDPKQVSDPPEDRDILIEDTDAIMVPARRGKGALWVASLTIAAFAVGSVVWLSRPGGTVTADEAAAVLGQVASGPALISEMQDALPGPFENETVGIAGGADSWRAPYRNPVSGMAVPEVDTAPAQIAGGDAPMPRLAAMRPLPRPEREAAIPDIIETPAPGIENTQTDAPSAEVRDIRVVLNAPRTVPDASLAAVIDALQQSGARPDSRRVNLTISTSNVRYFHPEDAEAAAVIAEGIGARLRDFTDFQPAPPEGLVEIWMAGSEIASRTRSDDNGRPLDQFAQDLRQLQRDLRRALGGN